MLYLDLCRRPRRVGRSAFILPTPPLEPPSPDELPHAEDSGFSMSQGWSLCEMRLCPAGSALVARQAARLSRQV